jgi:hypothetical protein
MKLQACLPMVTRTNTWQKKVSRGEKLMNDHFRFLSLEWLVSVCISMDFEIPVIHIDFPEAFPPFA